MDIIQRREKLKNIIAERREISVSELSTYVDVSGVTLRNDLIFLERKGLCKRLFGKVVACDENSVFSLDYNYQKHPEQKERIGKYAASLIKPGDSVLLYAGSTTQQVARFIDPEISFIAVTNSVYIALELRNYPKVHVVLLGGTMNHDVCATFGAQTIQQLREFNIDKLFISVDGVDAKMGITNAFPFESEINQVILERAKEIVVVADYTKIGNVSFVQMGRVEQIDMLITDSNADPDALEQLRSAGVDVKIV